MPFYAVVFGGDFVGGMQSARVEESEEFPAGPDVWTVSRDRSEAARKADVWNKERARVAEELAAQDAPCSVSGCPAPAVPHHHVGDPADVYANPIGTWALESGIYALTQDVGNPFRETPTAAHYQYHRGETLERGALFHVRWDPLVGRLLVTPAGRSANYGSYRGYTPTWLRFFAALAPGTGSESSCER